MATKNKQIVEPEVTRIKFDREIAEFCQIENIWRSKGIICYKVEYPAIELIFTAPQLKPVPIIFAVAIDFTNYDIEPPSIIFINPFNGQPITTKEMNAGFFQRKEGFVNGPANQLIPAVVPILVGEPDKQPFLCIPGVREYHSHPQHTGNAWLLSRTKGEGKLAFLIDQLYNHCIPFIRNYNINMSVGINQQIA